MNPQNPTSARHTPLGFGIVPETRGRGDEKFRCASCDHVTAGVSDPVTPDPPVDGVHELHCPRCHARLCRCPACGEETSVRPDGNAWRCDACNAPIADEQTLHRNIPTLRQLGLAEAIAV